MFRFSSLSLFLIHFKRYSNGLMEINAGILNVIHVYWLRLSQWMCMKSFNQYKFYAFVLFFSPFRIEPPFHFGDFSFEWKWMLIACLIAVFTCFECMIWVCARARAFGLNEWACIVYVWFCINVCRNAIAGVKQIVQTVC